MKLSLLQNAPSPQPELDKVQPSLPQLQTQFKAPIRETEIELKNTQKDPAHPLLSQTQPQHHIPPQESKEPEQVHIKIVKDDLKNQIFQEINYDFPQENVVETVSWNFDDSKFAVAYFHKSISIWDVKGKAVIREINEFEEGNLAWHPRRNLLSYLSSKNSIRSYDFDSDLYENININDEIGKNFFLIWHPNEEMIAYNNKRNQIVIHHFGKNIQRAPIETNSSEIRDLKWSNSGDRIAYSGDNALTIWDNIENRELFRIEEESDIKMHNINWLQDNKIAFLCTEKTFTKIRIWNIEEDREEGEFAYISELTSIHWSPDGRFIAAGNKENTIAIWDALNFVQIMSTPTPTNKGDIKSVKWNHDGSRLSVQFRKSVSVHGWNTYIDYGPKKKIFDKNVSKIKWSQNKEKILFCFEESFQIWDSSLTNKLFEKELNDNLIDIAWTGDQNSEKLTCLTDDSLYYQNFKDNTSNTFEYEEGSETRHDICMIKYDNKGSLIAGAGNRKIVIMLVDANGVQEQFRIEKHSRNVVDLRWNKDNTQLLSSSRDGTVKVWKVEPEKNPKYFLKIDIKEHIGYVNSAFWDDSEENIISVGADQYLRIFNNENGNQIRSIYMGDDNIRQLSWFKFFDQTLLMCLSRNSIRILDYTTAVEIKRINFKFEENNNKLIQYVDSNLSEKKVALAQGQSIYIYSNLNFFHDFETFKYLSFLIDYLPQIHKLKKKNSELVIRIVNYYFFEHAPSAFHILSILKLENELDLLIRFCMKKKIYPKNIFDDKKYSLFMYLNELRLSSIDLFLDFAIESDLLLGNCFHVTFEELKKYAKKNSYKAFKLLENRFRIFETEKYFVKWSSDNVQCASYLNDAITVKPECIKGKAEISNENPDKRLEFIKGNRDSSSDENDNEKASFKILDIPIEELGLDFIISLPNYNSFEQFCQSPLFISIFDILWKNGVLNSFLWRLLYYFLYFLIIIVNSIIILPYYLQERENNSNQDYTAISITFLILSIFLLILLPMFIKREISEINSEDYWKSFWNYVDLTNIIMSLSCNIFNIIAFSGGTNEYGLLRVFHSICLFFSMIRMFDFFRAFKNTSFLIETVLQVVYDMKIFVFLMALFISTFSFSSKGNSDPFDEMDSPIKISLICFYIIATLLLVIVMLNLLIAIVSDTNQKIASKNELIYEKNRVSIIKEYLQNDANKQKMKEKIVQKYLIQVTRINSIKNQENNYINQEIQNILKRMIDKKIQKSNDELKPLLKKNIRETSFYRKEIANLTRLVEDRLA